MILKNDLQSIKSYKHLARVNLTGRYWEKTKLELLQDLSTAEDEQIAKERDIDVLNKKVDVNEKQFG